MDLGVDGSLGGLGELLIRGVGHETAELDKDRFHGVVTAPVCETGELGWIDDTVPWADAREVDFGYELDGGWLVGVLVAAVHLQRVDAVLMNTVRRAEDGTVPV